MKKKISEQNKKRILYYRVLAAVFVIFFVGLFALGILMPDKKMSSSEKRMLSQFPKADAASVFSGEFGDSFEEYASDQMPARNAFVSLKTLTDRILGKNESQGVYRCKDGYMMEKMEEPDEAVLSQTLTDMKDFAAGYASNYSFVLVPNAVSVYSEKLPAFAVTASQADFSASVAEQLNGSNIVLTDLTDALTAAKDTTDTVYYRTDHHWTTQGAYACLPQVAAALGISPTENWTQLLVCDSFTGSLASKSGFSATKTDSIYIYQPDTETNYLVSGTDREGKQATIYSEEGLNSTDPYTVFLGGNDGYLHIETDQAGKGSLLVFKDSYFNCFLPFLLSSYKTIDIVDPRYFCDDLQSLLLGNQYTNVLFFYNMNSFSEDTSLSLVLEDLKAEETGQE